MNARPALWALEVGNRERGWRECTAEDGWFRGQSPGLDSCESSCAVEPEEEVVEWWGAARLVSRDQRRERPYAGTSASTERNVPYTGSRVSRISSPSPAPVEVFIWIAGPWSAPFWTAWRRFPSRRVNVEVQVYLNVTCAVLV